MNIKQIYRFNQTSFNVNDSETTWDNEMKEANKTTLSLKVLNPDNPQFLLIVLFAASVLLVVYICCLIVLYWCLMKRGRDTRKNKETQTDVAVYTTSIFISPTRSLPQNVISNENFCEVSLSSIED